MSETLAESSLRVAVQRSKRACAESLAACSEAENKREDGYLRLEALRLAIGQGGSDAIIREKAEAFLAFLKGESAPEKERE